MICAACGLTRDAADLLAFWPVGRPDLRRFVCRVTRPSPAAVDSCFRRVVSTADVHTIGPLHAAGGPVIAPLDRFLVGESGPELVLVPHG